MRGNKRKVTVELIEKESIYNQRLVEYLANKYRERRAANENL